MIEPAIAGGSRLRRTLEAARARARALGRPVLVSRTDRIPSVDPIAFFAAGARVGPERAFWARPDEGLSLVGLGVAWTFERDARDRFDAAARAWRGLIADGDVDEGAGAGPVAIGGFAFDPTRPTTALWRGFPAARLVLPRLLLTRRGDDCWLTVSLLVEPETSPAATLASVDRDLARLRRAAERPGPAAAGGDRPRPDDVRPADEWRATVAAATAAIAAGAAEKIVLARAVEVAAARPFDLGAALARLRAAYPTCALFALASAAGCFLGASPERLVRLTGGEVEVSCLAGTIGRGATAAEDARLGAELLASRKNREEHAVVVRELAGQLADRVIGLDVPAEPVLMKVRNVQHLHTPLRGRLAPGGDLLELVARLHPTPAVGGRPRSTALEFIRARERLDRGWYAGPVGWLGAGGDGELVVALRSALLRPGPGGGVAPGDDQPLTVATLFAGCGIVAESDPEAEYAESVLKLAPMLTALGGA